MDIVPQDEMLTIETEIMPNLIDRVAVGDDVYKVCKFFINSTFGSSWDCHIYIYRCFISGKNEITILPSKSESNEAGLQILGNRKMPWYGSWCYCKNWITYIINLFITSIDEKSGFLDERGVILNKLLIFVVFLFAYW